MHAPEGRITCGSHAAGHDPHWIQVLRVAPDRPHLAVEDLAVGGGSAVRLRVGGRWERLHNHRPDRVLEAWQGRRGPAWWIPGARLLRIEHGGTAPCFDLASAPIEPCAVARVAQERFAAEFAALVAEALSEGA